MKSRPLKLTDELKAACTKLREFAEKPENWYVVGKTTIIPGDRDEYMIQTSFGYRVVFTITHAPEHKPEPFRHISVSVPSGAYPNPIVVWTFAHLLGFTGATMEEDVAIEPGPTWGIAIDKDENCIVVQQPFIQG